MRKSILVVFIMSVMVMGIFQLAVSAGETEGEQNVKLTRQIFEEVWNKRNLDRVDALVAPNCTVYSNGKLSTEVGPGIVKKMIQTNLAQFPDFSITVEDAFSSGDRVTFRYVFHGTFDKLKKAVENEAIGIFQFKDGKLVKIRTANNQMAIFQQLGFKIVPPKELQPPKEEVKDAGK